MFWSHLFLKDVVLSKIFHDSLLSQQYTCRRIAIRLRSFSSLKCSRFYVYSPPTLPAFLLLSLSIKGNRDSTSGSLCLASSQLNTLDYFGLLFWRMLLFLIYLKKGENVQFAYYFLRPCNCPAYISRRHLYPTIFFVFPVKHNYNPYHLFSLP